jgi:hypothetical protein
LSSLFSKKDSFFRKIRIYLCSKRGNPTYDGRETCHDREETSIKEAGACPSGLAAPSLGGVIGRISRIRGLRRYHALRGCPGFPPACGRSRWLLRGSMPRSSLRHGLLSLPRLSYPRVCRGVVHLCTAGVALFTAGSIRVSPVQIIGTNATTAIVDRNP